MSNVKHSFFSKPKALTGLKVSLLSVAALCIFGSGGSLTAQAQDGPFLPGSALPQDNTPQTEESESLLPQGPNESLGFGDESLVFEKSPEEIQAEARDQAFDAALQGLLPLRPEEIRKLLEHFDRTQESVELPVYPAPKPEVTVETLSLDPGTAPKVIKVAYGYVTTLNMVDSTGAPWPIQNITWAGNFDVVEVSTGETGGGGEGESEITNYENVLRITPQSEFAYGNMSISMIGLKTPVIISLETSRDIVHYRFDAIIPESGPFAQTPIIDQGTEGLELAAGNVDMSSILGGVAPPGAVRMEVSGVDSRTSAYRHAGLTYLRTPLTLLSPSWISSASSADGLRVYAMNYAPVVLLSDKGKTVRARLSDREDIFDE